jgi:hypothetical protein
VSFQCGQRTRTFTHNFVLARRGEREGRLGTKGCTVVATAVATAVAATATVVVVLGGGGGGGRRGGGGGGGSNCGVGDS